MKNTIIIVFTFFLFSCDNNDDSDNKTNTDEQLTKDFLLNEKWYIRHITSNKETRFTGLTKGTNILEQNEDCMFDDYIIFTKESRDMLFLEENELIMTVFDNENSCWDDENTAEQELYRFDYNYEHKIKFNFFEDQLISLIPSYDMHWLNSPQDRSDVIYFPKQFTAKDSIYKSFYGYSFRGNFGNQDIEVVFEMIAYPNDRP